MGAYERYSRMFKNGIIAKAKELGYSADNICILEGNIEKLKSEHPATYQNLLSCVHNRDNRTPIAYARDLVSSWIFEDTLVKEINNNGLQCTLAGADRNRQVLATSMISSASDTIISDGRTSRLLEIMCDYTGWWENTGHMELRDDKFQKLVYERALFIGICTISMKYIILDFRTPIDATYIARHRPYGNKPAQSIKINPAGMNKFNMPTLIPDIKKRLCDS